MRVAIKSLLWVMVTSLALAGAVWLASSDKLEHYPNNRILNQSAISAIKTVGPVSAGFELTQRIDISLINDSHASLYGLPLCVHVFLDATDGTYFPGTLSFELSAAGRTASATLHSSQIPNTFKRICFPQSSMRMLVGAQDATLRISVLEPDARNVARIVLTPAPAGASPAQIGTQPSDLFLPHMIEVQRPPNTATTARALVLLAFAAAALLIILAGSVSARRQSAPT